jgi:hypothetical protein
VFLPEEDDSPASCRLENQLDFCLANPLALARSRSLLGDQAPSWREYNAALKARGSLLV